CPHVRVRRDAFGNLVALYQRGRMTPRFAFAAHMDHPGWVKKAAGSSGWEFLGSVPPDYLREPKLAQFGDFAMWDLPAFELHDGRIHSRACDDLLGCVAIVAMFRTLEKMRAECSCAGI